MAFSVLMSVFKNDSPDNLDTAIRSVWSQQSVLPSEIILVLDGPLTEQLWLIIDLWQERLAHVLVVKRWHTNQGLGAALRSGLILASNELVARMDADDVALSHRFERQLSYLDANPSVDVVGAAVEEIDVAGKKIGERYVPVEHESIISNLWTCPLIHPTVMFRRSRILAAGNYSANLPRRQDYELWFRCAEHGLRFHNLSEILLQYRFGEHTHKKQSPKVAWHQGMIGYKGSGKIGIPIWYRLLCFVPFFRSLLPKRLQHSAYKALARFDPRKRTSA
jgi:glycosyltransferase involved in cell wall biosynthesis